MDSLANSTFTTFTFKHVYFMDNMTAGGDMESDLLRDVPAFLHLLRHPVRGENFIPKAQPKSVHRTYRVKTVRAHYASNCLQVSIWWSKENPETVKLQIFAPHFPPLKNLYSM